MTVLYRNLSGKGGWHMPTDAAARTAHCGTALDNTSARDLMLVDREQRCGHWACRKAVTRAVSG